MLSILRRLVPREWRRVSRRLKVAVVASKLPLEEGSPCPACDLGALRFSAKRRWTCDDCGVVGDAGDLVAFTMRGRKADELGPKPQPPMLSPEGFLPPDSIDHYPDPQGYNEVGRWFAKYGLIGPWLKQLGEIEISGPNPITWELYTPPPPPMPLTAEQVREMALEVKNNSRGERSKAVSALSSLGPLAMEALPELEVAAFEEGETFRGNVLVAIGRIGVLARPAVPTILRAIEEETDFNRYYGLAALGRIRPTDTESLSFLQRHARTDSQWQARTGALWALGEMGILARAAIPTVEEIEKSDEDERVRESARKALLSLRWAVKRREEAR